MGVRDKIVGAMVGASLGANSLQAAVSSAEEAELRAQESMDGGLANLELSIDAQGWSDLTSGYGRWDFPRELVRRMVTLARLMFVWNPLIHRAVIVQELYVWGGGVKIKGDDPEVDRVLQDFFQDRKNQRVIGEAWPEREREQRIEGNTFLVFYRNKANGSARVRLFPFDQITDIIYNPEDAKEPWFYRRSSPATESDIQRDELYPDIDFSPSRKSSIPTNIPKMAGLRIRWDNPVLHISTGGMSQMKYGIPEIFSALPWATAYKKILENFATILGAYARMAMQITGLGGKKGIAATKTKLNTALSSGNLRDTNPPPNTAGWGLFSGEAKVAAIKTSGSTTAPDEARELQLMVAAGTDLPIHFFGDSDIGNYATSATLDRPTELKMVSRQRMWMFVIIRICEKLKQWSALAPQGKLRLAGYTAESSKDIFDGGKTVTVTPPKGRLLTETIKFPNILERDVVDRVRAVVQAITLGGSPAEGIFPGRKLSFRLLLEALSIEEDEAEKIIKEYYPKEVYQGFFDPKDRAKNEELEAKGKADLGQAALDSAAAAKVAAKNKPKPSGSPAKAVSNK